jgi:hypothetical protein
VFPAVGKIAEHPGEGAVFAAQAGFTDSGSRQADRIRASQVRFARIMITVSARNSDLNRPVFMAPVLNDIFANNGSTRRRSLMLDPLVRRSPDLYSEFHRPRVLGR